MVEQRFAHEPRYGAAAKLLHWLILALLVAQYAVAWTMPDIGPGTQPETLIDLHMSLGLTILAVAAMRLIVRILYPVPLISDNVPAWQQWSARASHGLLYVILFALPLLGWFAASGRGWAIDFWGANAPRLMGKSDWAGALGDDHTYLSYVLLGLVGLHVLAALYHHVWLRDRVLVRMLPGGQ